MRRIRQDEDKLSGVQAATNLFVNKISLSIARELIFGAITILPIMDLHHYAITGKRIMILPFRRETRNGYSIGMGRGYKPM